MIIVLTTQKYSKAIELNYYNEEYYIKQAAAFTKLGNYKGGYGGPKELRQNKESHGKI